MTNVIVLLAMIWGSIVSIACSLYKLVSIVQEQLDAEAERYQRQQR